MPERNKNVIKLEEEESTLLVAIILSGQEYVKEVCPTDYFLSFPVITISRMCRCMLQCLGGQRIK